jgi:hypothetical protein
LLVQFEVDGFSVEDQEEFAAKHCKDSTKENLSDLVQALSNVSLGPKRKDGQGKESTPERAPISLLPYDGYVASHDSLVELKTRSIRNPFPVTPEEIYAQAIWSCTPTTIVAVHRNGTFENAQIFKLSELEGMEETRKVRLGVKKVGRVLKELVTLLQDKPAGSKMCLICKGVGAQELYLKAGGRGAGMTANSQVLA